MRQLLRTTVLACLMTTAVGAQEAPPDKTPPAGDRASETSAAEEIITLIKGGKLDEAAALLGEAKLEPNQAMQLRNALVNALVQTQQFGRAAELLEQDAQTALESMDEPQSQMRATMDTSMLANIALRAERGDAAVEVIDQVAEALQRRSDAEPASPATAYYFQVVFNKARLLLSLDQRERAVEAVDGLVERARKLQDVEVPADGESGKADRAMLLVNVLEAASSIAPEPEQQQALFGEAREQMHGLLEARPQDTAFVGRYLGLILGRVTRIYSDDPEAAQKMVAEAREQLEGLDSEDVAAKQLIQGYGNAFAQLSARIESALRLEQLIGAPAPPLDAQYWAHGDEVDLSGKVVLLDFWAVWCGPCVATFPHLREWQQEYGEKGFQVVGVTSFYDRVWDPDSKSAVRSDEEVSDEQELEMLDQFMTHHDLLHPTIVTPESSDMAQQFGVAGIPHAVLIDREGKIRMIKVGSGPTNAEALQSKIVELLDE